MSDDSICKYEIYQHFRNKKYYKIIDFAYDTNEECEIIIYQPMYECKYKLFTRRKDDFLTEVMHEGEIVPRFNKVIIKD